MQFRVVKIKTAENTYEYLITNLPTALLWKTSRNAITGDGALKVLYSQGLR